jgi:hypothetical protein
MVLSNSSMSHGFQVNEIAVRGVPVSNPINNELDYLGTLIGLERLPEERNDSYKGRLLDVYVSRANSSYTGLVNGITRELGLEFFSPITITLKPGVPSTVYPRIEFVDNSIFLWRDSYTQDLEMKIDRSDPSLPEYRIQGLVNKINTSLTFQASFTSGQGFKRSDTIVNQSSSKLVQSQVLTSGTRQYLVNRNLDKGSLVFSDRSTFKSEVASFTLVNAPGKYSVDYTNGVIQSFNIPEANSVIQYSYRVNQFSPKASPVIVRPIHGEEFQRVLFNQVPQPNGSTTSGTPTIIGASIINELLSVVPMFWGE